MRYGIFRTLTSSRTVLVLAIAAFVFVRRQSGLEGAALWIPAAIQTGIALLILQINRMLNIVRIRTYMPALIYLLLLGVNHNYFREIDGSIMAACFAVSYFFLFLSFRNTRVDLLSLNITLILIVGSLMWSPLLYGFLFMWYGFFRIRTWQWKIIPASLIGVAGVYLCYFTYCVYQDDLSLFAGFLPNIQALFQIQSPDLSPAEWALCGFLAVLNLLAAWQLYFADISVTVHTINSLKSLFIPLVLMFALFMMQTQMKVVWSMIIFIPVSLILSYYFCQLKINV
jgi:hypothetical protein